MGTHRYQGDGGPFWPVKFGFCLVKPFKNFYQNKRGVFKMAYQCNPPKVEPTRKGSVTMKYSGYSAIRPSYGDVQRLMLKSWLDDLCKQGNFGKAKRVNKVLQRMQEKAS